MLQHSARVRQMVYDSQRIWARSSKNKPTDPGYTFTDQHHGSVFKTHARLGDHAWEEWVDGVSPVLMQFAMCDTEN